MEIQRFSNSEKQSTADYDAVRLLTIRLQHSMVKLCPVLLLATTAGRQLATVSAARDSRPTPGKPVYNSYLTGVDVAWRDDPRSWHQQAARIVDHRFLSFAELRSFAMQAKRAGASALMVVQPQDTVDCPGSWYNGLQLCGHINGTNPAADGSVEDWQKLATDLEPVKLMWWTNPVYWSVQGEVWKQAASDRASDVSHFFSWDGVTANSHCFGYNPKDDNGNPAQGSWGSTGADSGVLSGLASFGSPGYADYLVDALANSWTKNLGFAGYTIDCSANYPPSQECPEGMLQCDGDAQGKWGDIVGRIRAQQPQVVVSGEAFGSWDEVMHSNSDMGGQGFESVSYTHLTLPTIYSV